MILLIRTDKPEAEIGLFDGKKRLAYETWQAHRQLAETIHLKINALLKEQGKTPQDITGIVVYQGPGSFTGLRIGISVANALAYSQNAPIAGSTGDDWVLSGLEQLAKSPSTRHIVPEYGQLPHITKPRK